MTLLPHQKDIIRVLKSQGTVRLALLSLITNGIYAAWYVRKQSEILNGFMQPPMHIPKKFTAAFLAYAIISLAIIPFYLSDDPSHIKTADMLSNIDMVIFSIFSLTWSVLVCARLNMLLGVTDRGDPLRSRGAYAFLFGPLYFNYRVNKLCKINGM